MIGTFWAFMPAIIAIVLALATKQVYVSLFLGIFVGAMMYVGGDPLKAFFTLYQVMSEKIGANAPIIVFLAIIVFVLNVASMFTSTYIASRFGKWNMGATVAGFVNGGAALGIVVDHTTAGVSDSQQALTYTKPRK